jgi:hypothetical protein
MTALAWTLNATTQNSKSMWTAWAAWGILLLVDSVRLLAHGIYRLFVPAW